MEGIVEIKLWLYILGYALCCKMGIYSWAQPWLQGRSQSFSGHWKMKSWKCHLYCISSSFPSSFFYRKTDKRYLWNTLTNAIYGWFILQKIIKIFQYQTDYGHTKYILCIILFFFLNHKYQNTNSLAFWEVIKLNSIH